jgi:hypothetical protein
MQIGILISWAIIFFIIFFKDKIFTERHIFNVARYKLIHSLIWVSFLASLWFAVDLFSMGMDESADTDLFLILHMFSLVGSILYMFHITLPVTLCGVLSAFYLYSLHVCSQHDEVRSGCGTILGGIFMLLVSVVAIVALWVKLLIVYLLFIGFRMLVNKRKSKIGENRIAKRKQVA